MYYINCAGIARNATACYARQAQVLDFTKMNIECDVQTVTSVFKTPFFSATEYFKYMFIH